MRIRMFTSRVAAKAEQIVSFFRHADTPVALTLDSLRLKRTAFAAISSEGLRLRIRPRSGESFTFYENLIRKDYLRRGIELRPGDTVVDIGANIGAFTVLAASAVGSGGRVIAFEPVEGTFRRLGENIALNNLGNVECRRAAIDAQEGTLAIHTGVKSAFATAYLRGVHGRTEDIQVVDCLTIARVLAEYRIDRIHLLKLDCEGSEYGIIDSLTPELASRIDQIAMEVHPVEGRSPWSLGEALRALGFQVEAGEIWVAHRRGPGIEARARG